MDARTDEFIKKNAVVFEGYMKIGRYNFFSISNIFVRNYLLDKFTKEYDTINDNCKDALLTYYILCIKLYKGDFSAVDESLHDKMIDKINEVAGTTFTISDKDKVIDFINNSIEYNSNTNNCLYVKNA